MPMLPSWNIYAWFYLLGIVKQLGLGIGMGIEMGSGNGKVPPPVPGNDRIIQEATSL